MNTKEVQKGSLIDYKLRLRGIPIHWRSSIDDWSPPAYFVDNQVRGPYKVWHHRHLLIELKKGTLMKDVIFYRLPLQPLTELGIRGIVDHDVQEIFQYRFQMLNKILASMEIQDQ